MWHLIENDVAPETKTSSRGLKNGGKVIGQLERSLIFLFILVGQLPGCFAERQAAQSNQKD